MTKNSKDEFPWEKGLNEIFSKNMTFEDLGYLVNELTSVGLQVGGFSYAIGGSDPNHIRDGILILVGGKLIGYGYKGLKYLERIYRKEKQ